MDPAPGPLETIPPPQLEIVDACTITGRHLTTRLDRELAFVDLTWAQARVLLELAAHRGLLHGGEVARRVGVTRQAAHRSLAALDRAGYLTWRDDGWIKSARLTPTGKTAVDAIRSRIGDTYDALWRVDRHDLHALVRAAQAVRRELRRGAPEPAWWLD
jgi:DNA-binding MarR family transcriptional regulator